MFGFAAISLEDIDPMKAFYWSFYLSLLITITSCSSSVPYSVQSHEISRARSSLSYKISKKPKNKTVFIIPDNLDSLKLYQTELAQQLNKQGYRIIFPGKAGTHNPYLSRTLDNKTDRVNDLISLYHSLLYKGDIDTSSFIIMGFGEGAYLSVAVSNILQPDCTILINAGPYSPVTEMGLIAEKGHFTKQQEKIFPLLNVYSPEVLRERIAYVYSGPDDESSFLNGTNKYYRSYMNAPLLNDFLNNRNKVVWIVSEDYFLLSDESKAFIPSLLKTRPVYPGKFYLLEGRGHFNRKKEDLLLTETILQAINSLH